MGRGAGGGEDGGYTVPVEHRIPFSLGQPDWFPIDLATSSKKAGRVLFSTVTSVVFFDIL